MQIRYMKKGWPMAETPLAGTDWPAIRQWRKAERERLRNARLELSASAREDVARALSRHLDTLLAARGLDPRGLTVSGYWPIKAELDLRPWMESLAARGARLALPVVVTAGQPLVFRLWQPGMKMEKGIWGIAVPPETSAAVTPDVSLAPVVGWDRSAYRLGYGGGYFDRTLASLNPRPLVIGVGLQSAGISSIHPQPHDIGLDVIVTEQGVQAERHARA